MALKKSDSKYFTVFTIRAFKRLIGKVEEVNCQAKYGVEVSILAENGNHFYLHMGFCNTIDEMFEEVIDGALSLLEIHAFRCEFADRFCDIS
jgi:hypothetical protein